MAFCHCSGKIFICNWIFYRFLPQSYPKLNTPKKMKTYNFQVISSFVFPWIGRKRSYFPPIKLIWSENMFWTKPRGYQVKNWLFHFLGGVRFAAARGQKLAKSSIPNKKFSWTVAERHCLCRHSIGLSESKNEKSRTLPDFFPLSQILGFGCRTMANHKWCIMIFWWFQFFFHFSTFNRHWTLDLLHPKRDSYPLVIHSWWMMNNL